MVRRAGGELKAIDYTEYFAAAFRQLPTSWKWPPIMPTTKHLRIISAGRRRRFCKQSRHGHAGRQTLGGLQDTSLEFTLSRENYDDEITPAVYDNGELKALLAENGIEAVGKDTLGARVGIVNKAGTDLILQFKNTCPSWRPKCRLPTLIARASSTAKN